MADSVKSVDAAPGWTGHPQRVQVRFEPETLGTVEDELVVNAGEFGEYRCRLVGVCRRPQPQGPLDVGANTSRDLTIRNVFGEDQDYVFTIDNPNFQLGAQQLNIKAKSTGTCVVKYQPTGAPAASDTAKLFVSCPAVPDMPPWVFYLKGT